MIYKSKLFQINVLLKRNFNSVSKNQLNFGLNENLINQFQSNSNNIHVFLALSSGVDSTMAAYLMMKRFPNLKYTGIYLNNWDHQEELGGLNSCPSEREWSKVQAISKKLNIPSIKVNLIKNYWNSVFEPTLNNYQLGKTPNPDILCNKEVKFGVLWDHLNHYVNGDEAWLVTGHYATVDRQNPNSLKLLQGVDPVKDQTYYLAGVPQNKLDRVIFPLGTMYKSQIKQFAKEVGFGEQSEQKESMGICFIGKRPSGFQQFLSNYLHHNRAKVVSWKDGKFIMDVNIWEFTLGQRLRGTGLGHRWYVGIKNIDKNVILAVNEGDHPCMYTTQLTLNQFEFFDGKEGHKWLEKGRIVYAKVRSTSRPTKVHIRSTKNKVGITQYKLEFIETQRGLTPGQFIVFYNLDNSLIGCSPINEVNLPLPKWWSNKLLSRQ